MHDRHWGSLNMSRRIRMYDYLPSVFIRCRQLSRAIVVSHKKKAPVNHRGNHKNRVGIYGAHIFLFIVRRKIEVKRENCAKTFFYRGERVARENRHSDWINDHSNAERGNISGLVQFRKFTRARLVAEIAPQ